MPHLQFVTTGPISLVLVFFVAHLLAGVIVPYRKGYMPFLWALMESAGFDIDRRLNRVTRTETELFVRGFLGVVIVGACGYLIGVAAERITMYPYGWIVDLLLLSASVTIMGPLKVLRAVLQGLIDKKPRNSAAALQPYFRDSLAKADEFTLIRKAIEFSAISLNQYCIAPVLFFVFFQSKGLVLYVTFTALYEGFGIPNPQNFFFGRTVRVLEAVLDFIPARLGAILIALSALFVSRGVPSRALGNAIEQARYYAPRNRGWLVAAVAGALGVTLGGPVKYEDGHLVENKWIGPKESSAKATPDDLKRAAMLHFVAFLCLIVILSCIIMV